MPRGQKTCNSCGTATGPRAWACPKCGVGFVIRGEKKPDMDPSDVPAKTSRLSEKRDALKKRLWNLVEVYDGKDEKLAREKYDMTGQTWQSKCGSYRVREQYTYMGVDMKEHFSKCVYLLKWNGDMWEVVRPKGVFRSPLAALRRMVTDQNGKKPKATTKKEKLAIHTSRRMNRKAMFR